jgi:hypothetical protein
MPYDLRMESSFVTQMQARTVFKIYLTRSGFLGLIVDLSFVVIALLSLADWQTMRGPVELAKVSDLVSYSGKAELKKPWKTAPYIAFRDAAGLERRFSCFGPYQRQYWCDSVGLIASENQVEIEIKGLDDLVYELNAAGKTLVPYDLQVQRFQKAISAGPSNVRLYFSLLMICLLIISVRSRIQKGLIPELK